MNVYVTLSVRWRFRFKYFLFKFLESIMKLAMWCGSTQACHSVNFNKSLESCFLGWWFCHARTTQLQFAIPKKAIFIRLKTKQKHKKKLARFFSTASRSMHQNAKKQKNKKKKFYVK